MAKEYCKEQHIEYHAVDVAEDQARAKEMIEKSGQMGVPVIVVPAEVAHTKREEVIVGFDRERLANVLGL
jgi:glutaredoxin